MIRSKRNIELIVERSGILKELRPFQAIWVGTIPIEVHIETSDVDIICKLEDNLPGVIKSKFGDKEGFSLSVSNDNVRKQHRLIA